MKKLLLLAGILASNLLWSQDNHHMQLRGHLEFPGKTCANIWGYADTSGNEYALVGTSTGLSIVDVTSPDSLELLFEVPSVENFWREVKTWNGYAYLTTEGENAGLTIIDLRSLPDTMYYRTYFGNGAINNQLSTIHALHIDNGYCYLYGSNIGVGGMLILDLADPWNPNYVGQYNNHYVHDGIVLNDTAWAGNIYNGFFTVIDVSTPSNPIELAQQETPGNFTHNTWLTDDRNYLLTTDEVSNSFLTSYSIDNLNNITELDRYQTSPGSNCIVHNTHILNDYAVTSWYTEGVVIVDNDHPDNLIEVAKYDFSDFEGDGFHGCWGVYPYLPSGNIIASDIETGLWVLTPTYLRGCYLEGSVFDSTCGTPIDGVTVTINPNIANDFSNIDGVFKLGTVEAGTYSVTLSKAGYNPLTIEGLSFVNGETVALNVNLFSESIVAVQGEVQDISGNPIEGAQVVVSSNTESFNFTSDENGAYTRCDLQPGNYTVVAGEWGFITDCDQNVNIATGQPNAISNLENGYYDDFQFDFGWTQTATASAGFWQRAVPVGTNIDGSLSNPNTDVNSDCNTQAFVTGNAAGTGPGSDDVDNGCSQLISPLMELGTYTDPYIKFHYWFFNGGGNDTVNDTLYFRLRENNSNFTMAKIAASTGPMSQWVEVSYRVKDFIANPGSIRFIVDACDLSTGHLVEAGIDQFEVFDSSTVSVNAPLANGTLEIMPNPSNGAANLISEGGISSCNVFDVSGRLVYTQTLSSPSKSLSLPALPESGMYLVRVVTSNGKTEQIKWIVQ